MALSENSIGSDAEKLSSDKEASGSNFKFSKEYSAQELPTITPSLNLSAKRKKAKDRQNRDSQRFLLDINPILSAQANEASRAQASPPLESKISSKALATITPRETDIESSSSAAEPPPPRSPSSSDLSRSDGKKKQSSIGKLFSSFKKHGKKDSKKGLVSQPSCSELASDLDVDAYTFEEVVHRATDPGADQLFQSELLRTFPTFCRPIDLLSGILTRFERASGNLAPIIQLRCVDLIKHWYEEHQANWRPDHEVLQPTLGLFRAALKDPQRFGKVLVLLDRVIDLTKAHDFTLDRKRPSASAPLPIMPNKLANLNVLMIDPLELARQLTLIDHSLLCKLQPKEFLKQEWMKEESRAKTPNINRCVMRFNVTSRWVVAEILREEDMRTRVQIIRHFLKTAEHLIALKNFNGLLQIASALECHAVFRLKSTFAHLSDSDTATLNRVQDLCSSSGNHRALWAVMKHVSRPCVPYLGMFLSTFNMVAESCPRMTESGRINWNRQRQMSRWLDELFYYSKVRYDLRTVPLIKDFILNAEVFDDDMHYKMSYYIQPRESDVSVERRVKPDKMRHLDSPGYLNKGDHHKGSVRTLQNLREKLKGQREVSVNSGDLTFISLITKMCSEFDATLVSEVLVAYHGFCTSEELLATLLDQILHSSGPNRATIQQNCLRVIQLWIEDHWASFSRDISTLQRIVNEFWEESQGKDSIKTIREDFSQLLDYIQEMIYLSPEDDSDDPVPSDSAKPIFPARASDGGVRLLDIDPVELARQLTLMDLELFKDLHPWEFIEKKWTWSSKQQIAPSICKTLEFQDTVRGWVEGELLSEEDLSKRRMKLKHFLETVNNLLEMKNFSSVAAMVTGLTSAPVSRLEKTFAALSKSERKLFNVAQELTTERNNYSMLWGFQRRAIPPTVPLLKMYLDAICRIEELHDMFPTSEGLIDLSRFKKTADLLIELRQHQFGAYKFVPLPQVRAYINNAPLFDEKTAMELSVYLESASPEHTSRFKPFALMTSRERAELGFYESDSDWMTRFPVVNLPFKSLKDVKPVLKVHHGTQVILGATLEKLIELVTLRPEHSPEAAVLLNTFREYCSPFELFEKLRARWNLPRIVKKPSSQTLKAEYKVKLVDPVQQRILGMLSDWLNQHRVDFDASEELTDALKQFVETVVAAKFPTQAALLRKQVYTSTTSYPINPPLPLGPFPTRSAMECIAMDFNPLEIARQLTLMQFAIFKGIAVQDLIGADFSKSSSLRKIEQWNEGLTRFVIGDVRKVENNRAATGKVLAHWCYVAQNLYSLKNWSSVVPVIKGIRHFNEDTASWKAVPPDLVQLIVRLDQTVSHPNSLRSSIYHNLEQPRSIPALTPILEDLEYIKDKQHPLTYLKADSKVVNFERCAAISAVIESALLKVKRNPYPFADIPSIQRWIHFSVDHTKPKHRTDSSSATESDLMSVVEYAKKLESIVQDTPSEHKGLPRRPQVLSSPRYLDRSDPDSAAPLSSSTAFSPRSDSVGSDTTSPRPLSPSPQEGELRRSLSPRTPSQIKRDRQSIDGIQRSPSTRSLTLKKRVSDADSEAKDAQEEDSTTLNTETSSVGFKTV